MHAHNLMQIFAYKNVWEDFFPAFTTKVSFLSVAGFHYRCNASVIAVIGFNVEMLEVAENSQNPLEISLELVTPMETLPEELKTGILDITIGVNQMLSTATFGISH